jgi:hypothetical protein
VGKVKTFSKNYRYDFVFILYGDVFILPEAKHTFMNLAFNIMCISHHRRVSGGSCNSIPIVVVGSTLITVAHHLPHLLNILNVPHPKNTLVLV